MKSDEKNCLNCRYHKLTGYEPPCDECQRESNWVPKEEKKTFETVTGFLYEGTVYTSEKLAMKAYTRDMLLKIFGNMNATEMIWIIVNDSTVQEKLLKLMQEIKGV